MTQPASERPIARAPTGVAGLDAILGGGLPQNRLYLVQGTPGVGKTTLALQFLREGVRLGERALYLTLSETEAEIRQVADSHGWSLDGIELFELNSAEQTLRLEQENTLYATADIDLRETMKVLLEQVSRVKAARVVFDSMSEVRLLAQTPIRYRRQLLALKQHFAGQRSTVLLLDDRTADVGDAQVESIVHGVISLEQLAQDYGGDRRRMRIEKLRGSTFRSGWHDFVVETGGIRIFPRLVAAEFRSDLEPRVLPSGIPAFDRLLGDGIDRSTATLVTGPAGTGKSVLATQFACAAGERGEHVAMFLFEERKGTLLSRSQAMGLPLRNLVEKGTVELHPIDPAELAPDQFSDLVRRAVEERNACVVVIDSLNGYFNAMPDARHLMLQMHEMLSYLAERGAATILTLAQTGGVGAAAAAPLDVSYLADTIVLLRYFEAGGRVRKAVSIVKKRSGGHEDTIRELTLGPGGLKLGEPLVDFHGVLTGTPAYVGSEATRKGASDRGAS